MTKVTDTPDLAQQRTELYGQIRKLADEFNANDKKWASAESRQKWDKVNAEYDSVLAKIEQSRDGDAVLSRLAALEKDSERIINNPHGIGQEDSFELADGTRIIGRRAAPGSGSSEKLNIQEARELALTGWCCAQMGAPLSAEMQAAAQLCGLNPHAKALNFALPGTRQYRQLQASYNALNQRDMRRLPDNFVSEYNAPLTTGTPSTGGNLIPPETLMRNLEVSMLHYGGVRQVAETIVTASGEDLSWPTANDTGNTGRQIDESTEADDNAGQGSTGDGGPNPAFGKMTWGAFKFTSDTILVPFELLQDSAFNLVALLGFMLGERLGRITNTRHTLGNGTTQPQGIVVGSSLGVTAAGATAITGDEVIDLEHSVDPAYRIGAGYMFKDSTLLHLRKLKDQENRYLWQSGFNSGAPDTINARPYTINQDMAAIAAEQISMLFGQLSKFKIRRVGTIRLYRLEERYRERDQDGFVAFLREDGGVLDAGTDPIKHLAHPAAAS